MWKRIPWFPSVLKQHSSQNLRNTQNCSVRTSQEVRFQTRCKITYLKHSLTQALTQLPLKCKKRSEYSACLLAHHFIIVTFWTCQKCGSQRTRKEKIRFCAAKKSLRKVVEMQYKFYDHMICKVWSKNTSNNNTKNFKTTKIENSQQNWAQSHHEKNVKWLWAQ